MAPSLLCVWAKAKKGLARCTLSRSSTRRRSKAKKTHWRMKFECCEGKHHMHIQRQHNIYFQRTFVYRTGFCYCFTVTFLSVDYILGQINLYLFENTSMTSLPFLKTQLQPEKCCFSFS